MNNSNLNSVLDQTYRKKSRKCCDVISGNKTSMQYVQINILCILQVLASTPWTNLSAQSLQPTFSSSFYQLGPKAAMKINNVDYCTSDGYNGGGCLCIDGLIKPDIEQTRTVFRFLIYPPVIYSMYNEMLLLMTTFQEVKRYTFDVSVSYLYKWNMKFSINSYFSVMVSYIL